MAKYKSINFAPVQGYLLLEPLEDSQPEGWNVEGVDERPQIARVLKVGEPTYYENSDRVFKSPCKVGDTIIHSSMGFENITIEGKEYRMLPFLRVLMVKK